MKSYSIISAMALALAIGIAAPAQPAAPGNATVTPPAPTPAPAKPVFTDAQLIKEFGWFLGKRSGLGELELSKADMAILVEGLALASEGKESPYELQVIGPVMGEFMQHKQQANAAKAKAKNSADAAAFFTKLKENKNIVVLPSGLAYEVVAPGSGPVPNPTDTVTVNYSGALINGEVFDHSQPGEPAQFVLNQVIPGWTEGLQKISKGGKMKLYVPSALAYGDEGNARIPPSSTLVFDVELLDIKPAAAAAPVAPVEPVPAAK